MTCSVYEYEVTECRSAHDRECHSPQSVIIIECKYTEHNKNLLEYELLNYTYLIIK